MKYETEVEVLFNFKLRTNFECTHIFYIHKFLNIIL